MKPKVAKLNRTSYGLFIVFLLLAIFIGSEAKATNHPSPTPAPSAVGIGIGTGIGFGGQGGRATGGYAIVNNSIKGGDGGAGGSISTPSQWPSGFLSGYAGFSQYNCANAVGINGGYGSLLIPWESSDCKRYLAAQMFFARGSIKAACKMLMTVSAVEDAGVTFDDCMADYTNQRVVDVKPTQQLDLVNRPKVYYDLKKKYPGIN